MEIAIGVIFLALFAGVFFLLILIAGFYFWRRSKRRNGEQNRQFTTASNYGAVGSRAFDNTDDDDNYLYTDTTNYSNSSIEEAQKADSKMGFGNANSDAVGEASGVMIYERAAEGGGSVSSDSGGSPSYESSTNYESSSSYDSSSSSSDSGSSSSSSGSD